MPTMVPHPYRMQAVQTCLLFDCPPRQVRRNSAEAGNEWTLARLSSGAERSAVPSHANPRIEQSELPAGSARSTAPCLSPSANGRWPPRTIRARPRFVGPGGRTEPRATALVPSLHPRLPPNSRFPSPVLSVKTWWRRPCRQVMGAFQETVAWRPQVANARGFPRLFARARRCLTVRETHSARSGVRRDPQCPKADCWQWRRQTAARIQSCGRA